MWSADIEPETVERPKQVADAKGSVWWGRFGQSGNAISARRLGQLQEQLKRGIPTGWPDHIYAPYAPPPHAVHDAARR
jgi:hypothetical protein